MHSDFQVVNETKDGIVWCSNGNFDSCTLKYFRTEMPRNNAIL